MTSSPGPRFPAWTAVLALAVVTAAAAADPKEVHKQGVTALESGRWDAAARFFRAAIDERADERVPTFGKPYLPHFYLGVALAEAGNCRGALAAWAESERQGKLFRAKDLAASLPRRKSDCQEHLRQVDAARSEVGDLLEQARGTSATLDSLAQNPALARAWSRGSGSFGARRRTADEQIEGARQQMDAGSRREDLRMLAAAKEQAAQGLQGLRRIISEARQELGEINAATAEALEGLEEGETAARHALRSVDDLAPLPRGLASRYADVERLLATIADRRDVAQARELVELKAELAELVEQLESAARRPPWRLFQAVEAFLAGQYQEVLDTLGDVRYRDRRAALHLCVLKAASRHALFVLGGEAEPALVDEARAEVVACHERYPSFEPDRKFFSPRFIAFYDEAVRPPELEETPEDGVDLSEPAAAGSPR